MKNEALELWKELIEFTGDNPYEFIGDVYLCFFCVGKEKHKDDCIWMRAKELIEKEQNNE